MIARSPIKKQRPGPPRRGRVRDPKYLAWIREQDCVVCRAWYDEEPRNYPYFHSCGIVEAAHVGERGLGQKCSDLEVLPLGGGHHRTRIESHHRLGKNFWSFHNLDRDSLIAGFQARYEMEKAA